MRNRTFMHTAHDDSLLGAEPPKLRKSQKKSDSAILSEESPSKKKSAKAKKVAATKPKPTKKKAPVKADRGKGLNVLFEVALSEADQLKEAIERSKKDSHASHPCSSSIDERTGDSGEEDDDDENDSEDESDDDGNDDADDDKGNDGNGDNDDDANNDDNIEDDDMNDNDEELIVIELRKTESKFLFSISLALITMKKKKKKSLMINEDAKMTDGDQTRADQQNVSKESGFEKVEEDADVTLTPLIDAHNAKFFSTTSFPALPDFASVFKFNERVTNLEKDLSEIKQVNQYAKVLSSIPTINNVAKSLEAAILTRSTSQPKSTYEAACSLSEFELTNILIDKMDKNKSYDKDDYKRELYDALIKSYETDKDLFNSYGESFTLKKSRDDQDKDRDPSTRSDRGTKRRKLSKDVESSRDSRSKEKKSSTISKDASHSQHKSSGKSAHAEEPSHTVEDSGVQHDQEFVTGDNDEQPIDKETWISQVARAEEPRTLFDELMDTSFDFFAFVLNRLKIKDLTQEILIGLTFNLLKGTYKSLTELKKRTIAVTRLSIMKKYDYGHLEEIQVRREDQELYTFREGDFPRLRLQDIEDMLLLLRRVEDLQLGVESYQKKLNLTKPDSYRLNLKNRTAYTSYSDPHGTIYVDQFGRKRLMRADKLHKFIDGMLNDVRSALHDIVSRIRMEYIPKKKWSNLDKRRDRVMVQDIDKKLFER
ncbi:hypothetical protein Tco_1258870 [Tanacetum coccineum]